jgi:hypothetical protein
MNDPTTLPSDLDRITALLKAGEVKFWPSPGYNTPTTIELVPVLLVFNEAGELVEIEALG